MTAQPARWKGHLAHLLPKRGKLSRGHHAAMAWRDVPAFLARLRERETVAARVPPFDLSYFDADLNTAGARFAVRRLRRRLGEATILAGFWRSGPGELCAATKADFCATSFKEALAFCLPEAVEEEEGGPGKIGAKPAAKFFAGAAEN